MEKLSDTCHKNVSKDKYLTYVLDISQFTLCSEWTRSPKNCAKSFSSIEWTLFSNYNVKKINELEENIYY